MLPRALWNPTRCAMSTRMRRAISSSASPAIPRAVAASCLQSCRVEARAGHGPIDDRITEMEHRVKILTLEVDMLSARLSPAAMNDLHRNESKFNLATDMIKIMAGLGLFACTVVLLSPKSYHPGLDDD